ncbi:MAG: hypothetical protein ABL894_08020, partial [Hyphomicrobium sp.]
NAEMQWPTIKLSDGKEVRLDDAAYTQYRQSPVRADRDAVFRAFFGIHKTFQNTYGTALDAGVQAHLFRRDVWTSYETSQRARSVPMRFLDLNAEAFATLDLDGPIESVPTVLVLQRGKEIGRIPGYVGPEFFFHSIDRLLAKAP